MSLESAPGQNTKKVPKIVLSEFKNSRKVECTETIKNAIKVRVFNMCFKL